MESVSIVGAGKAGRTLGRLLRRAGYRIESVVTAHLQTAREAAAFIGAGRPSTRLAAPSAITLIAVPDGEVANIARRTRFRKGQVVFHLCGNFSSAILRPARPAAIGSMHPLKSFARPDLAARTFRGTTCVFEGDARAERVVRRLIRRIGGVPMRVRARNKALYHAAAVFASNYLVTLLDVAQELFQAGGIRRPQPLLALARGTLQNVENVGTARALTGPIQRGDHATVRTHRRALRGYRPELARLYAALAERTAELASRRPK
jgi:predicted short-subunit dehydrogenase-like oxidoreductase (DUF2520 family)